MDNEFQIHAACGLFILVLHFQHRYDPYDKEHSGEYLQHLDTTSVLILLVTMWSAVFFYFQLCDVYGKIKIFFFFFFFFFLK